MKSLLSSLLLAIVAFGGQPARGQDSTSNRHSVSVGINPFFLPVALWGGVEVSLTRSWSVGAQAARVWPGERRGFNVIAGEVLWYPSGSFEYGPQLVAHAMYMSDSVFHNGIRDEPEVPGIAQDYAAGILLGYKYTFTWGLTGNAQFGVLHNSSHSEYVNGYKERGSIIDNMNGFSFWGYFNIGWSF